MCLRHSMTWGSTALAACVTHAVGVMSAAYDIQLLQAKAAATAMERKLGVEKFIGVGLSKLKNMTPLAGR